MQIPLGTLTRCPSAEVIAATPEHPDYERLLVEHTADVKAVVRAVARRFRLNFDEQAEFSGALYLRLIEDDYRVFRKFAGRSTLRTYLTVVAVRLFLDTRNQIWGRWRPSVEARQLGPTAIRLETLRRRDGYSLDEAVAALTIRDPELREGELRDLDARLPSRLPRPIAVQAAIEHICSRSVSPDLPIIARQASVRAARVASALRRAVIGLAKDDRRLLRLRFREGLPIVNIAGMLNIEQRSLYRRFARILETLRRSLEGTCVTRSAAAELVGDAEIEIAGAVDESATRS